MWLCMDRSQSFQIVPRGWRVWNAYSEHSLASGGDVALPLSEAWLDPLDEQATGGRKYAKHLRFHELKI